MRSVKELVALYTAPREADNSSNPAEASGASLAPRSRLGPVSLEDPSSVLTAGADAEGFESLQDSHSCETSYETGRLLGKRVDYNHESPEALELNEIQRTHRTQPDESGKTVSHAPVPATIVFARDAPPLFVPELDTFLSKLPPPSFSNFSTGVRAGKRLVGSGMFPPMDRLAATNRSILDLETNSVVAPVWRNSRSILGGISNLVLSITGSSVVATFYSLHNLMDVVQIFALICSTIVPLSNMEEIKNEWKKLFLGTIPNILALNFGTKFAQSSIVLGIIISVTMVILYFFWSQTNRLQDVDTEEAFPTVDAKDRGKRLIFVCFALSVLYLPLSTIVIHALVWSDDFWAISNPYTNATANPPIVAPLGPLDEFRDPLDFCYTTTMKRNEVNFAPIVVIVSAIAFAIMTIWFPLRLRTVIKQAVPKVDRFTERGTPRSASELDRGYQRLIERDQHPLSFLYYEFKRGWGTYKSIYLFAKLSALFIISAVLCAVMVFFFLLQCFWTPFIDPVSNASEWTSRLSYLLTSLVGLAAALELSWISALDGPVLYIIYVLTYGFAVYFTCINFGWMQRIVKRLTGRMDFSIDVFSPRLDLSAHVKRRTWQETITTLFLTSPDCQIPREQPMLYATAKESDYPPYLLGFKGTPAERFVENLKILREVGLKEYVDGTRSLEGSSPSHTPSEWIQREYTGPDMLWMDHERDSSPRFGTAWWIPFPPTLVIRYDDGGCAVLKRAEHFAAYVNLNRSREAQRKRQIRLALRALDGQIVQWPHEYREPVGKHHKLCCFGSRYRARRVMQLYRCIFRIQRKGRVVWQGLDLGSGFDIKLIYSKDIELSGDLLGLSDDWELTPTLARFLALNQTLVLEHVPVIEWTINDFRRYHRRETQYKAEVLSYSFLMTVYDQPQDHEQLMQNVADQERDLRVRQLVLGAADAVVAGYERYERAVSSEASAWWYIFWDDLWRRNHDTIRSLRCYEKDFNPYYPTSIAYTPLPRPALEAFLRQRGLYSKRILNLNSFFHAGLLNKMYFWLCEIVFRNSSHVVFLHVGEGASEFSPSAIDALAHGRSSSLGTGGGTDHDDPSIRARPNYRWEALLEDPIRHQQRKSALIAKLGVWLGITPLWREGMLTRGIALDVKLDSGRYVLISRDSGAS